MVYQFFSDLFNEFLIHNWHIGIIIKVFKLYLFLGRLFWPITNVCRTNANKTEAKEETIEMKVNEVYELRSNIASAQNVQNSLQDMASCIYEKCV